MLVLVVCVAMTPLTALAGSTPPEGANVPARGPKAPPGSTVDANGYPCVAGEVLVKFDPVVGISTARSAHAAVGVKKVADVEALPGLQRARLPQGLSVGDAVARYRELPGVAYAQPNYLYHASDMPTDPRFDELWGMNNTGQTGGTNDADIDAPEAWDVTTGDSDIVVAVIDTGVDYNHPDLADQIWTNPGEIADNGLDDDGNGYIDDIHGYDFFNYDGDPLDDEGHGTHCSGTIGAASNNDTGVAGVAWDVRIMGVKFLSADGWGDTVGAVESIAYAEQMGADIMSNSWGGGPDERVLRNAIADTNALFVVAAGNEGMDTDKWASYPSGYNLSNILAVGATDHNDEMSWFSNWGASTVDVFAPGEEILSTVAGPPPTFVPNETSSTLVSSCDDLTDWDVGTFENAPWAIDTDIFNSDPASFSLMDYQDGENAWIEFTSPIDLSGHAGAALRFQAYYDIEQYWDYLHAWVSADGVEWTNVGSFSGLSNGFSEIVCDITGFVGDSDVYLAFSFSSDESIDSGAGYTGVAVDDIEIVQLDPLFTERFDDLSAWDTSGYSQNPWTLQTDWVSSPPSAAGNLDYVDDEASYLRLAAPLDLSSATGDLALNAKLFYEIEPPGDHLDVLASTDGSEWMPLASYTGRSGMFESGFTSVTLDLSEYAGASEVYLAFALESNEEYSSADEGLTGAAVDDLNLITGTWYEADYSNAYATNSGTSMSTPHVSGIAALVMSEWPGKSAEQIKGAIILSADYLPQLDGLCVSDGRANAFGALADLYGPDVTHDALPIYTGSAEIRITATDDSGVESITYQFDGEEPVTVEADSAVAINAIPAKSHWLKYSATDALGNTSDPVTVGFVLLRGAVSSVTVAGQDRYATAIAASQMSFPDGADTVVIATGANWPDALGGTGLAGAVDGPILLTEPGALPDAVAAEIERLGATKAYVLGGTRAVSAEVVGALTQALGTTGVERISGADRYATARLIADEVITLGGSSFDGIALVATGENFPDALAAAPVARYKAWPILLANPDGSLSVPDEVSSAVILGGTSAVPDGIEAALIGFLGEGQVIRKGGTDRYGTAALVCAWSIGQGMHWEGVGITTGRNYADALAGGAMLGAMRSVVLLTEPDELPVSTRASLSVNRRYIQTVHFIGGTSAVSQTVRDEVMLALE